MSVMKTTVLLLCCLAAAAALGQSASSSAVLSNTVQMPSHDLHASQQSLGSEQSLLEHFGYFYAHGERPLWEVAPPPHVPVPLGDIARMLRKEHAVAKKADKIVND